MVMVMAMVDDNGIWSHRYYCPYFYGVAGREDIYTVGVLFYQKLTITATAAATVGGCRCMTFFSIENCKHVSTKEVTPKKKQVSKKTSLRHLCAPNKPIDV